MLSVPVVGWGSRSPTTAEDDEKETMSSYPTDDSVSPTTPIYDETLEATAVPLPAYDVDGAGSTTDQAKQQAKDTAGQAKQTAKETAGVAKDEAGQVAGAAKDAGQRVAGTTKDQASRVAQDAMGQARELYGQAASELSSQASQQQTRAASTLRTFGNDLSRMGENQDGGLASELVQNLSRRASGLAEWLDQREPGDVLHEVRQYAARRPGVFIALAATAGVVGARLTKALVADAKSNETGSTYEAYDVPPADLTTPTYVEPATTVYDVPPTTVYDAPTTPGYDAPTTSGYDVPPVGGTTGGVR